MSELDFLIAIVGFIALCGLCLALAATMGRVDVLTTRVDRAEANLNELSDLVGKLIGDRVTEVANEATRRLNTVEGRE